METVLAVENTVGPEVAVTVKDHSRNAETLLFFSEITKQTDTALGL